MSKIVQAINSMIENRNDILYVTKIDCSFNNGEYSGYYFKFLKYIWSIKNYNLKPETPENAEKIVSVLPTGLGTSKSIFNKMGRGPIKREFGEFALVYYPDYSDIKCLQKDLENGIHPAGISYTTEMDKTREAYESYADLYRIVREKLYNVDNVLDDIISLIDKSKK